ncbi:hypothetical protein ACHAWF_002399, partial [Thalassiosira exigua]
MTQKNSYRKEAPLTSTNKGSKRRTQGRGKKKRLPSPQEDLDAVAGKQVILRPRLGGEEGGSSGGDASDATDGGDAEPVVYYYDPRALPRASSRDESVPELALPEVVYDAAGRALSLAQVHAGGRNEVFLEVRPGASWGSGGGGGGGDGSVHWTDRWTSFQDKIRVDAAAAGRRASSQDQLIVFLTVATMAVVVGALSAKRLRSRHLLESCLHPELDEEWDAED